MRLGDLLLGLPPAPVPASATFIGPSQVCTTPPHQPAIAQNPLAAESALSTRCQGPIIPSGESIGILCNIPYDMALIIIQWFVA